LPAYWDGDGFRLRFAPTRKGAWSVTASVHSGKGDQATDAIRFSAGNLPTPQFVHAKGRYFQNADGTTFYPIGLNLCWADKRGLASYDARFATLRANGGNFARIWTTQEKRLEDPSAGLGRINLDSARYYDQLFSLAGKHSIRTMWTFDDYRVLTKTDYFNAHWDKSPYNAVNGGPLMEPNDFFHDPQAKAMYRRKLRYVVARYSAFTSIAFWELWNEQDNIPKPGVPIDWFREMTAYLAELDPYRRTITTSYSWDDKAEVWASPSLGLVQRHMYGQGDTVDFVGEVARDAKKLLRYDKPFLIGEFGITWKEPDLALDKSRKGTPLHDALWASVMTGHAGGALTWWWDNYLEPANLWGVFRGISRFVADIDFVHRDFRPIEMSVPGFDVLGMQDAATSETILWLHDPASNWKSDATGTEPAEHREMLLQLSLANHIFGDQAEVEIWDTRTREIISRIRPRMADDIAMIELPPFHRDIALHLHVGH